MPCFGIAHDHPVDEYLVGLDSSMEAVSVRAGSPGAPVFVQLPNLLPGRHLLSVKARRRTLTATVPGAVDAEGFIALDVRDPRPWVPGTTSFAGLSVSLDPPAPNLDTFWEGNVNLSVLGPEGESVICSVTLLGAGDEPLLSQQIGNFSLPIEPPTWSTRFRRFTATHLWDYLGASKGTFAIASDDLGRFTLRLERDVKPLRWICRHAHRGTTVRLIDDTGLDPPPAVSFFSFQQPLVLTNVESERALTGVLAEAPGGLFVATQGEHTDALVLSTPQTGNSLQTLLINPRFLANDNLATATSILDLLSLWSNAHSAGPLAGNRRDHITKGILRFFYGALAGQDWTQFEADYLAAPRAEHSRERLARVVGGRPAFAVILRRDYQTISENTAVGERWFAELAARYEVCSNATLCNFALRLASCPFNLPAVYKEKLSDLLAEVKQTPVLLRGARLLALLSANDPKDPTASVLPSWIWQ